MKEGNIPNELPKDYFERFPERIKHRIENDDTNYQSQILTAIGKRTPYKTPEGYFDGLTDRIIRNCDTTTAKQEKRTAKTRPLSPRRWMLVAATLTLLLMYTYPWKDNGILQPTEIVQLGLEDSNESLSEEESLVMIELIEDYTEEEIWQEAMASMVSEGQVVESFLNEINDTELNLYLDLLLSDITDLELNSL